VLTLPDNTVRKGTEAQMREVAASQGGVLRPPSN
jgi:hypothetical protein